MDTGLARSCCNQLSFVQSLPKRLLVSYNLIPRRSWKSSLPSLICPSTKYFIPEPTWGSIDQMRDGCSWPVYSSSACISVAFNHCHFDSTGSMMTMKSAAKILDGVSKPGFVVVVSAQIQSTPYYRVEVKENRIISHFSQKKNYLTR